MHTLLTNDPIEAARFVRAGELAAFPTETVYGLGADARNPEAVVRIFQAKGRPADNPLIVHLADIRSLKTVAAFVPVSAQRLLDRFAPGPITVVLPRSADIPAIVSAGLSTVGVRIPAHATAHAFLQACGGPVAAPSANRSGRPSPTTWQAVQEDLDGRIPCILQGPRAHVGLESTVVDCSGDVPALLRSGSVSLEALRAVIPEIKVVGDDHPDAARSPGTRHPHYAPRARVRVLYPPREPEPGPLAGYIGLKRPPEGYGRVVVAESVDAYAHALFDFFRTCDANQLERIDCGSVPLAGIGRALMDRLARAQAATGSD